MKTLASLPLIPYYVAAEMTAEAAAVLMEKWRVQVLGVLDCGQVVGVVSAQDLAGQGQERIVRDLLTPKQLTFGLEDQTRDVAKLFSRNKLEYAAVTDEGTFKGVLTASMMLPALNRSWDPMTELSWSDYLREWGAEKLSQGIEICVLFVDIDQFGEFNKRFNHHVGDRVLQQVARALEDKLDPATDILVRYGGDEFAIGSTRSREGGEELVDILKEVSGTLSPGEDIPAVTFSVGIFGGRRAKKREEGSTAATLDNLIANASRSALNLKKAKAAESDLKQSSDSEAPIRKDQPASAARTAQIPATDLELIEVLPGEDLPGSMSQVMIRVGDSVTSGVSSKGTGALVDAVARATAKALENAFPGQRIHAVVDMPSNGERVLVVDLTVNAGGGEKRTRASMEATPDDMYHAAANATLSAYASLS